MQFEEAKKAYTDAIGIYYINLNEATPTPDELILLGNVFKEGEGFLQLQEDVPNKDFTETLHFIYEDTYKEAEDFGNATFLQAEILRHYEYAWKIAGLMGLVDSSATPPPLVPPTEPKPELEPITVNSKLNAIARLIAKGYGIDPGTDDFDFSLFPLHSRIQHHLAIALWREIFGDVDPNADFEL